MRANHDKWKQKQAAKEAAEQSKEGSVDAAGTSETSPMVGENEKTSARATTARAAQREEILHDHNEKGISGKNSQQVTLEEVPDEPEGRSNRGPFKDLTLAVVTEIYRQNENGKPEKYPHDVLIQAFGSVIFWNLSNNWRGEIANSGALVAIFNVSRSLERETKRVSRSVVGIHPSKRISRT